MSMAKVKALMAKILNVLSHKEAINGTTGEVGIRCKRTDSTGDVSLMIGTGGDNHGVYSHTQSKWLIYGDGSNVYVNDHKIAPDGSVNATNSSNVSQGTITLYRRGGIVMAKINNFKTSAAASAQCATVPAGYRPVTEVYIPCNNQNYNLRITAAGVVSFTMAPGSATIYGSGCYAI